MNKTIYLFILLSLTCLNITVICLTWSMRDVINNYNNTIYKQNTREIIHLQDSMIKELSNVLWFEYDYDLPQFDGDYNEIIDSLKQEINL